MKITADDKFNFFVPVEFEKGTEEMPDGTSKKVLRIKGIASDDSEDFDGEVLDPAGFDLDYFNRYGLINWNHTAKNSPKGIIGEPTLARIEGNKMYVEGVLYSELPLAQDVYDLAELLQKSGSKRKLGFSIEGKAVSKDPMNKKRITRAKITGLAITATPVNSNTLVEVMKGICTEPWCEYQYEEESSLEKGLDANGGAVYIIDIERDGKHITVDKEFNIKICDLDKSLTTDSGRALIKEDVEHGASNQVSTQHGINNEKDMEKKREDREKAIAVITLAKAYEHNLLCECGRKRVQEYFSQNPKAKNFL
jgi:hypothetical protein